jgi:hypothetical protein
VSAGVGRPSGYYTAISASAAACPTTYDRYVRDRSFCQISEVLKPAWGNTADNPQCFLGWTCVEEDKDRF